MADTGHGATINFATSGWDGKVTGIGLDGEEAAVIDVTHYGTTTYREKIFGTLKEPLRLTLQTLFEPTEPATSTWPVIDGVAETITLTFPTLSGYATAATISGTGTLVSWSADMGDDATAMTGEMVVQYDGQTGPTYTDYIV